MGNCFKMLNKQPKNKAYDGSIEFSGVNQSVSTPVFKAIVLTLSAKLKAMKCTPSVVDAQEAVINIFLHRFGIWSYQSLDSDSAQTSYVESFPFHFFLFIHLFYIFQTILHLHCSGECYRTVFHRCFRRPGNFTQLSIWGWVAKDEMFLFGGNNVTLLGWATESDTTNDFNCWIIRKVMRFLTVWAKL